MTLPPELKKKAEANWNDYRISDGDEAWMAGVEWLYEEMNSENKELNQFEIAQQIRIDELEAKLKDAKEEIGCLRSVLSEWDQDKYCYTQMIRADELRSNQC